MTGKTVLVTGSTSGIGLHSRYPGRHYLTGDMPERLMSCRAAAA